MKPETYQLKLISLLENSISNFNSQLPAVETSIYSIVINLLKELQVDTKGKIINNTANLSKLARIKVQLEKSVLSDKWVNSVKGLLRAFKSVEALQNEYYASLDPEFRQTPLLRTITSGAIDATLQSLTESGLQSQVISKVNDVLKQNIISQVTYASLVESMQLYLKSTAEKMGLLSRYASQFVTDALNQYSASYTQTVAQDLGFKWFMYTGSLLTTSRPWCEHMVKKKYIHESEFPEVLKGHFDHGDVDINEKTKLPQGMMADTTVENLPIKRGGYNCGHQLTPVHESVVPEHLRQRIAIKQHTIATHINPDQIRIKALKSDLQGIMLKFSPDDLLKLAGGIPVKQASNELIEFTQISDDLIAVQTDNEYYKSSVIIDTQEKRILNRLLSVEEDYRGGAGKSFIATQVKEALKNGYKRIDILAAQGGEYVGFNVWGRMGFVMQKDYQREFDTLMKTYGRKEKTIFELHQTKEGNDFWNDHGFSWYGYFDLSAGSESLKNLAIYLRL